LCLFDRLAADYFEGIPEFKQGPLPPVGDIRRMAFNAVKSLPLVSYSCCSVVAGICDCSQDRVLKGGRRKLIVACRSGGWKLGPLHAACRKLFGAVVGVGELVAIYFTCPGVVVADGLDAGGRGSTRSITSFWCQCALRASFSLHCM
jgi:hypothetical protein